MSDDWGSNINGGDAAWDPNRVGAVAVATTPTGQQPAFGSVLDLSTVPLEGNAFQQYVRVIAELKLREDLELRAQGIDPAQHRRELEQASNYEKYGLAMTDDSFSNRGDEDDPWYSKLGNEIQTLARSARANASSNFNWISSGFNIGDDTWSYEEYRDLGGQLTEGEWDSFSPATQTAMARRARVSGVRHDVTGTPGISHTLSGLAKLYQGAGTAGKMSDQYFRAIHDAFGGDLEDLEQITSDVPGWARRTWKEVGETGYTPGNALVDNALRPVASEAQLDRLRRTSSWYQMSSFGAEFIVGWYADPGVAAVRGAGNLRRVVKNEVPLNEASRMSAAVNQAIQGREISAVETRVAQKYASWRANRILEGRAGVEDFARNVDFAVFASLPMFRNRALDGLAAAKVLHVAANSENPALLELTWGALHGQKAALDQIELLKRQAPEDLRKFDPNASTFLNAYNATRSRANVLQRELDDLAKVPEAGSAFHRWELHTDIKLREQQLAEAQANLDANTDYAQWLNGIGTKKLDPTHPRLAQAKAPHRAVWEDLSEAERYPTQNPQRNVYQSDQFGFTHQWLKWSRNAWTEKANTVSMHDIDSGERSIHRYFESLRNVLDYQHSEGRLVAVQRWMDAMNSRDSRAGYLALHRMEEEHLIPALAGKLGVSEDAVRIVWDKINSEKKRTLDGIMTGSGRTYSSAPPLAMRLLDEAGTVRLVGEADDEGMVTLELLDGSVRTTVTVHESALQPRHSPVDVTQEVNYYTPADVRQLYLQMKRHDYILHELDSDLIHYGKAHLAAWTDRIGTTFYDIWKPAQLLRPGWPMRVLMDEGLRAAAIFGPMYWITGEGAKAAGAAARDLSIWGTQKAVGVPGFVKNKFDLRSYHKWLRDGPLGRYQKADPDPVRREAELATAPQLPLDKFPKVNKSRYDRIEKLTSLHSAWMRQVEIENANIKESQRQMGRLSDPGPDNGSVAALQRANERARRAQGLKQSKRMLLTAAGEPFFKIVNDWNMQSGRVTDKHKARYVDQPMAFDPVSGTHLTHGFFVPLPHLGGVDVSGIHGSPILDAQLLAGKNYLYFLERNAELLSRENIRVIITPDGEMQIGMWFGQAKKGSKKKAGGSPHNMAADLLRRVAESQPIGAENPRMFDLAKGETHYAIERDNLGQVFEDLRRVFQEEPNLQKAEGTSPGVNPDGTPVPQVYHGSASAQGLPEDLLPRNAMLFGRSTAQTGQMLGPGLYTTISEKVARAYALALDKLYTIRKSKSGQQVDIFDLDQQMHYNDLLDLREWVEANFDRLNTDPAYEVHLALRDLDDAWDEAYRMRGIDFRRHYPPSSTPPPPMLRTRPLKGYTRITWGNVWEQIFDDLDLNHWISTYLEETKNVGALTHRGGNQPGFENHQVYIWLHPEDLEISPAYIGDGTYSHLETWFANPVSLERLAPGARMARNPVPENRLVRFGRTNPALRELHTVHAQVMERVRELRERPSTENIRDDYGLPIHVARSDPEYQRLAENERSRMKLMGLIYNREKDGGIHEDYLPNGFGQNWYGVVDKDAFNRAVNEAEGLNQDFDWAAAADGDLRQREVAYLNSDTQMSLHDLDMDLRDPVRRTLERMKSKYGKGYTTIRNADGTEHHIANFGEGHDGEIRMGLTSSSRVIDYISAGHGGALAYAREAAAGHKTYHPPVFNERTFARGTEENRKAIQYFYTWTDMLNDQVGNSPIWSRMNKGWSDERIVNWLDNAPEGNRVRDEIMPPGQNTELWVNEHRAKLDYYLPSRRLQRALAERRLTPDELRRGVHNDDLPDVFGPDLEMTKAAPWHRVMEKLWNSLGTVPIDRLSRHPFAKATYDAKVRAQLAVHRGETLGPDDIERIEAVAQRHALSQVRRTLYDLADQTNLTDALRFIAPFWGAQQEAMMKWASIVLDRPETIARFFMGQRALYSNFVVVDENGEPVDTALREGGMLELGLYQPTDRIVFRIPDALRKGPLGKALESAGELRIPVGSANTVLQGEMPVFPSTGPLVNMPVDQFLRIVSETDGVTRSDDIWYRWLFPIGRPSPGVEGVMEQMLPGWGRRLQDAFGENDDLGHANLKWTVARELRVQAEQEGEPPPTEHEIQKATNALWALRTLTSFVSPVQVQYAPKHQFWLDEAHKMREEYGQNYFDKFLQKYGKEAMAYAISASNSLAHVPPTNLGMEEWAENRDLIKKFPHFGGLIISPDAYTDDYAPDAYKAQFDINLGGSSATKLREVADPDERQAEVERMLGWSDFRKISAAIDAQLMARGLTSIENNGAEDLKAKKAEAVSALKEQYPGWTTDYETFARDIDTKVDQMGDFAFNKEFDDRPDFAGLRQYLMIREVATQRLDENYLNGGSRSLQAQENTALREWFYDQVGQVVQSNPAFAEVYTRFLSNDTLMNGSG